MNGFQIGNKRLKVQHKRVHGAGGHGSETDTDEQQEPDGDEHFSPEANAQQQATIDHSNDGVPPPPATATQSDVPPAI
jgi:hypothetical protein